MTGRISRMGAKKVRAVLYEAAHVILTKWNFCLIAGTLAPANQEHP